jgi:hypothetical protein
MTWRGRVLTATFLLSLTLMFSIGVYPFLAVTQRERAEVLVVDGWIPAYSIPQVAREFKNYHYSSLIIARGTYDDREDYESGYYHGRHLSNLVVRAGVDADAVKLLTYPVAKRDRTYHSALAVKSHLARHQRAVRSLNIATMGPHARRSCLLYKKAFNDEAEIGVISMDERGYDSRNWWRTSDGVKSIISECAGYIYTMVFFQR